MFKLDGYKVNDVDYIVIDKMAAINNEAAMELLASRQYGVGADRILVIDRMEGKLISVIDSAVGRCAATAMDKMILAQHMSGEGQKDVSYIEIRLTNYFMQQLVTAASLSDRYSGRWAC